MITTSTTSRNWKKETWKKGEKIKHDDGKSHEWNVMFEHDVSNECCPVINMYNLWICIYIFETCVKILNLWMYISSIWILIDYLCIFISIDLLFIDNMICAYVWICLWHYAFPDFRVFDFLSVEGYAFKCLRFFKFLLSQTLNNKKVCAFLCVHCHSLCNDEFCWSLVWWQGIFFVDAFFSSMHSSFFLFSQILWAHMSCSFLLLLQVLWVLL